MQRTTKPTTLEQIEEYENKVGYFLFQMLKKRIDVTLEGITEEELFDLSRRKKTTKKTYGVDESVRTETIERLKKGLSPSIIDLPPIFFYSDALIQSGIPYLQVRAVSWLDKKTDKTLPHQLLSLVKKNQKYENQ